MKHAGKRPTKPKLRVKKPKSARPSQFQPNGTGSRLVKE